MTNSKNLPTTERIDMKSPSLPPAVMFFSTEGNVSALVRGKMLSLPSLMDLPTTPPASTIGPPKADHPHKESNS